MNSTAAATADLAPDLTVPRTNMIPWYCYAMVGGATAIAIGILWDISWHTTIGRDTFWTPAHLAIYLGGLLGGICSGWLVLKATFFKDSPERSASVSILGLRAPMGAWVALWGSAAMLTSAPFDDWWHNTYGLDVKVLSPPHAVLALGMHHIVVGAVLLVLSLQNRLAAEGKGAGRGLFIYAGGVMLTLASVLITEFSFPNAQHNSLFYKVACALYPVILVPVARASKLAWPATIASGIYMLFIAGLVWILPLFAATPKLAPINNPLTHMAPPAFPLLLIVPGLAMDLWMRWIGRGRGWLRDVVNVLGIATSFLGLLILTQWHFSKFLLSPAADNAFFGGNRYWSFASRPGPWQQEFWGATSDPLTVKAVLIAWIIAVASTTIGLLWGNWMSKVRR